MILYVLLCFTIDYCDPTVSFPFCLAQAEGQIQGGTVCGVSASRNGFFAAARVQALELCRRVQVSGLKPDERLTQMMQQALGTKRCARSDVPVVWIGKWP